MDLEIGILEQILQLSGKSVKSVAFYPISDDFFAAEAKTNVLVQKFARLVKIYCPNVEHLSLTSLGIEDYLLPFENCAPALCEQFSLQLRSVAWDLSVDNVDCLRLPDISMCTNIRKLEFPASPLFILFLRTRGTSVEFLKVLHGDIILYTEMMDAIEHNCTKLTRLRLCDYSIIIETVGEERYASFLCSLGSQLTNAEVYGLSIGNMAQVVKACPNLLIPSQFVEGTEVDERERVSLLGPIVDCLSVTAEKCRDEKWKEAIAKCTNLKSLYIDQNHANEEEGTDSSTNLAFFVSISSTSFNEFGLDGFIPTQLNIDMLSSVLKNLHCLTLNIVKPIKDGVDFKSIAQSNPELNFVYIKEYLNDDEELEKDLSMKVLRMLVNTFSKCRSIIIDIVNNETEIVTRDEMHDISGSLPCRGIDVQITVGSTWYLQVD